MHQLSILQVLTPGPWGGLESVVHTLAEGLARRGHEVRVAVLLDLEPSPHPFELSLARAGLEVVSLRRPRPAYWQERRDLAALYRRFRPQVVHTHGARADLQAGGVARRLRIPTVATVHGFTGGNWRKALYEWLQEWSLRRTDAVVAVSKPLGRRLSARGVAAKRLHLLPNAWSGKTSLFSREAARRELGVPLDAFVAGWVGRLSFEKGADVLLEALALLRDIPIRGCFIGEGPERAALERRTSSLGLCEQVRWTGERSDAGRLFGAFDVLVLSSRTEGTPIVLFEAMAAGVPIIASSVGGVPDVLGTGAASLVAPDDPKAVADALRELKSDRAAAMQRVETARQRLRADFLAEPWLAGYERIYQRVREQLQRVSAD